jgi:hypothetical protein
MIAPFQGKEKLANSQYFTIMPHYKVVFILKVLDCADGQGGSVRLHTQKLLEWETGRLHDGSACVRV